MKKGFTLVELLATIVILGIVILIAIPSYNVISNNIKRKQNQNKISYIETQAGKYVTESGLYSDIDQAYISVQTLLQNGYLDGDNKAGDKILDAYGNDITCYQIEVDFDKSKPEPKFIDEFVKNEDGICIYNDLKTKKLIRLDAYKTSSLSDDNKISIENNRTFWVKEDVLLKLNIIDEDLNNRRDQAIVKIDWNTVNDNKNYDQTQDNWYTIGWLDNVANFNSNNEYKNAYLVKTNKIMADTKFKISLIVNYIDDAGKKVNEALTTYLIVRIDKENPTVTATVDTNWTKENKKIYITGNDKQGSGLNHFCIFETEGAKNCNPGTAEYVEIIGDKGNKGETLKPKGSYFIYAIDNVGNISDTAARVVVDNIDTTKPTCVYDNQNTTWKKGSQTITIKCEDGENGSGCITRPYKVTFDSAGVATSTTTLPSAYIITDYAGNKETCLGPVDIYLDNVPPVVSFGNNGDNTYRKAHSSKVTVSDEQNGTVTNLKYLWASSNTASAANGTPFTNGATLTKNDGTGNFYLCIYSEDGLGNKATTCSNVFRFDNTPPTINVTVIGKVGTAAITDNVGLAGYAFTESETVPSTWTTVNSNSASDSYTATVPITMYVHAKDTLGNTSYQSFVIPPSAFCTPDVHTNIMGQYPFSKGWKSCWKENCYYNDNPTWEAVGWHGCNVDCTFQDSGWNQALSIDTEQYDKIYVEYSISGWSYQGTGAGIVGWDNFMICVNDDDHCGLLAGFIQTTNDHPMGSFRQYDGPFAVGSGPRNSYTTATVNYTYNASAFRNTGIKKVYFRWYGGSYRSTLRATVYKVDLLNYCKD